jgi:hypothetical protein
MPRTVEEAIHSRAGHEKAKGNRTALKTREEQIAQLAHLYWKNRQQSNEPGSDVDDWLRAEAEFLRRQEAAIDEASEESFPASDPPAR